MKTCPNCNTEYADSFKVCPRDGTRLADTGAVPAAQDQTVVVAPPVPASDATVAVPPPASDATVAIPPPPVGTAPGSGDPLLGTVIASRFRIVGKLGEGGMGAVYKAEHTKMDRLCAIKILSRRMISDPDALARFTREAQMSSRIDHPHAVTIYDYGESEDGLVYLAMEFIDGAPLSSALKREGILSLERTLKIARQIGEALDAAHALGIVHRDLKPDNIMVARKAGAADFVKVLDFGIAKMAESEDKRQDLTQAGFVLGTPFYMSPEQVSGQKLDARSDVYSFALIVYEMLTGDLPFGGDNTQAVMISRLTVQPKPLRAVNPHVPVPVESAVMRALVRDREARTGTAGQFVKDLEDAVSGRDKGATGAHVAARTSAHDTRDLSQNAANPPYGAAPPAPQTGPAPYAGAPPTPFPLAHQGLPPTDKTPGHAPAVQRTVFEGAPSYPPPPVAKKGGAGKWIALVLALGFLGVVGVGGTLAFVFRDKLFGTTATAGNDPKPTPSNGSTAPSTPADPSNDAAYQRYQKGIQLQQKGDTDGAIAEYRAAIAQRDKFPQAHGNLGAALVETGKYEEARKELNTAIQQDSSPKGEYYFNLGLASFKLQDYRAAADAFKKASTLDKDPLNYAYAGFALDNAGDRAGAQAEYQKYLTADPSGEAAPTIRNILAGKAKAPTASEM
jgi:serine/threonine protein kinase